MATESLNDVFRYNLGDIYDAEQQILIVLNEMETHTSEQEMRDRIRLHREETHRQIGNLEQCFELLGTHAPKVHCAVVRGLRAEMRNFEAVHPSPQAREVFNLDVADKAEHYEIASYRALVDLAGVLGQTDIIRLLRQNLRYEEEMSDWLEEFQPRFLNRIANRDRVMR